MGDFDDKHPPILALPGPQYPFDYSKGLPIGNNVIIVHQEGGQVNESIFTKMNCRDTLGGIG